MAQRTEKEETEFKVPETLTPCVNNCGVIGNPGTNNMCQKCFNASTAMSSSSSNAAVTAMPGVAAGSAPISRKMRRSSPCRPSDGSGTALSTGTDRSEKNEVSATTAAEKKSVNRCSGCRRKVGLTGFRCRCGELFCAEHRYSDRHDCSYDYKAAGRDAIARENPVVRAAKIVRV